MKGVTLDRGTVVVLELDGSLVYVEDVQATYAAVVALPEQPADRKESQVFTPGKVGAKKISPYSQPERTIVVSDLSPRNREFIGTYEVLRTQHGQHYVQRTPEEEAAMTVKKAGPAPRAARSTSDKQKKRRERRAAKAAGPRYLQRCTTCGEQPGHPNHPKDHEFVPPAPVAVTEEEAQTRTPRQQNAPAPAERTYTLVSEDLSAAKAQPRGDKFNEGNRSHRVVLALKSLPNSSGTVDDVIGAMLRDGKAPPANPLKVVRRTLNQLTTAPFGSCVSRS